MLSANLDVLKSVNKKSKAPFCEPLSAFAFLSLFASRHQSKRLLAVSTLQWRIHFLEDTVHHGKRRTSWPTICLSLDQGHTELRLSTAWCHGVKHGEAEPWGTARRVAIDFSLRDFDTGTVVLVWVPHLHLSHPLSVSPFLSFNSHLSMCLFLTRPTCWPEVWRGYFTVAASSHPTVWALWLWSDPVLIKHN